MATDNGLASWPSSGRPLTIKDREAVKKLIPVVEFMHTKEVSVFASLSKDHADAVLVQEEAHKAMAFALAGQQAQTRLMRLGHRDDGTPHPEIGHECIEADAAIMKRDGSVQEASVNSVNAEADEERLAWMKARAKVRASVVGYALDELMELVETE
jgi:hypothetical protein